MTEMNGWRGEWVRVKALGSDDINETLRIERVSGGTASNVVIDAPAREDDAAGESYTPGFPVEEGMVFEVQTTVNESLRWGHVVDSSTDPATILASFPNPFPAT